MAYSQKAEEETILRVFAETDGSVKKGRFLDLGAFDGKTFSNTLRLTELGWSGVCVEPSPRAFVALMKTHEANQGIHLINAAVGPDRHLVDFHDSPDAVSTTLEAHRKKWAKDTAFQPIYVCQVTIKDILDRFIGGYDFVNIDTEGTSADLFLAFPIAEMKPKCICVEHDGRNVEIANHGYVHGYSPVYLDGNNIILALR